MATARHALPQGVLRGLALRVAFTSDLASGDRRGIFITNRKIGLLVRHALAVGGATHCLTGIVRLTFTKDGALRVRCALWLDTDVAGAFFATVAVRVGFASDAETVFRTDANAASRVGRARNARGTDVVITCLGRCVTNAARTLGVRAFRRVNRWIGRAIFCVTRAGGTWGKPAATVCGLFTLNGFADVFLASKIVCAAFARRAFRKFTVTCIGRGVQVALRLIAGTRTAWRERDVATIRGRLALNGLANARVDLDLDVGRLAGTTETSQIFRTVVGSLATFSLLAKGHFVVGRTSEYRDHSK